MTPLWTTYESPRLGPLTLVGARRRLAGLFARRAPTLSEARRAPDAFDEATRQLDEYLTGARQTFELDPDLGGTALQGPCGSS